MFIVMLDLIFILNFISMFTFTFISCLLLFLCLSDCKIFSDVILLFLIFVFIFITSLLALFLFSRLCVLFLLFILIFILR